MTENAQVEVKTEPVPVPEVKPDEAVKTEELAKAREAEKQKFIREETLRRELEDTRKKLESIKKNGWDVDLLTKQSFKSNSSEPSSEVDLKKELQELKKEIEAERTRRIEVEELQGIVDFVQKSGDYELINNLEDGVRYVKLAMQEHYQNTGKHISYKEACDFVEEQIEKAELQKFEKFSKTKKASKLYNLKSAEKEEKSSSSKPKASADTTASQAIKPPEPKNLARSNSREAFQYFIKNHGK